MKRAELLDMIAAEARRQRRSWELLRHGANHDVYLLDGHVRIPVARHREVTNDYAALVYRQCAGVFGERWWKR